MPRKVALLIGVSQYGEGLSPLSAAPNDVAAVKRVLENPKMAGFDQVETLTNPGLGEMQAAIFALFNQCVKDDLLLLYFSGHGITDDNNRLYLANRDTGKDNFRASAVPASFIHQESINCYSRRQVIILDCCYSGAFKEGWQSKSAELDLQQQLGRAEGRVVLTSSTATQTSFQQQEAELSLYTQYLVEGIETGAADTDQDGKIYARELHQYARAKVQDAKPTMKPEILSDKEGFDILLSKAPVGDRTLDFRRLVEQSARQGDISAYRRDVLRQQWQKWGLTDEVADSIIDSVLEPFRRRRANLERFRAALQEEVEKEFPLDLHLEEDLRDWQRQVLGLADQDVAEIWQQITAEKVGDDAARKQRYAQEFSNAVRAAYPLSSSIRQELSRLQQSLGLSDEQVTRIEAPLLEQAAAQFEQLRQQEAERLKQQRKAETQRQQAAKRQQQQEVERLRQQRAADRDRPAPQSAATVRQTRQQFLKWAGFGGGGLVIAVLTNQIFQNRSSEPEQSESPVENRPVSLQDFRFEIVTVNAQGKEKERRLAQAKLFKQDLGNSVSLEMVAVPGNSFQMGSPESEKGRSPDEGPQHTVTVRSFFIGKYPVTQAQWKAIATLPKINIHLNPDPSHFQGSDRPVESISWHEAVEFCDRLARKTGRTYRLSSEAEWEYACRAGTKTPFHFGETITTALAN